MLASKIKVDFMGTVDYFLGTAFTWKRHADGELSAFLSQTAFTEYMAHRFAVDTINPVLNMTPYRSGLLIDAIPPPDPKDPDLKRRTKCYQSMVGCINWLAACTRPDVSPVLTFLASYSQNPAHQHYKAALHVIKYLLSTSEYGISYHSHATSTVQAFNHFPHHHDREAYSDATPPPPPSDCRNLTAFSDACWGHSAPPSKAAPLSNCLNLDPSLGSSLAAPVVLSPGSQFARSKPLAPPAKLKSLLPTPASPNCCISAIAPSTWALPMHLGASSFITTTKQRLIGRTT
eukprot:CCRYP_008547-RA/>CCRYP_008547-RA protein AED:0.40 eAED:0.59 QI:0/-1/0/1/-1/1/1/0/288